MALFNEDNTEREREHYESEVKIDCSPLSFIFCELFLVPINLSCLQAFYRQNCENFLVLAYRDLCLRFILEHSLRPKLA
jgi:hypothetical protein